MRQYELMYILDPLLEEEALNGLVTRFQTLIENNQGTVEHSERWERRRLAYEIKGRREGFYVVVNFSGTPATEAELDRVLGITDGVIRYMITRMDERVAKRAIDEARKAAEAKAQAEAAAAEAAAAAAAEAAAAEAAAAEAAAAEKAAAPAEEATGTNGDEATETVNEETESES